MPKTETELQAEIVNINRATCYNRGLGTHYGYNAILGVDLVGLCLDLRERFNEPIRILDVGCGNGLAIKELEAGLLERSGNPSDFEIWGMGLNKYADMLIPPDRFIKVGLYDQPQVGLKYHLVISVFTFHYMWHKLEGLEKIHNRLLLEGGQAVLHFPGYLVRFGDGREALLQDESEGNRRFAEFIEVHRQRGDLGDMKFRLLPHYSDDEDCSLLTTFGNIRFEKEPDSLIRFGHHLKAFALFTKGFDFERMMRRPLTYVASHYNQQSVRSALPSGDQYNVPVNPYRISVLSGESQGHVFHTDLAIHSHRADTINLICPGAHGQLDNEVLDNSLIAEELLRHDLGAVVRFGDPCEGSGDYAQLLIDNLQKVISFTVATAHSVCFQEKARLNIMAYSSSAGAVAAIASEYTFIDKLLLMAPSFDIPRERILPGLEAFKGEVYIMIGESDDVVLPQQAQWIYDRAVSASKRVFLEIPCCGHDFEGPFNLDIYLRAPLWAFGDAQPKGFPRPHLTSEQK